MRNLTLMVILAALAVIPAIGDYIELNDGGSYIVNDNRYEDDHVWLDYGDDYINTGTTFELNSNGIVGGDIVAFNISEVDISGGVVGEDVWGYGDSLVNISNGIVNEDIWGWDDSDIQISGGTIGRDIHARENSGITISGGSIDGMLESMHSGIIYLDGSGFSIGGVGLSNGDSLRDFGTLELLGFGDPFYTGIITGNLSDGSTLNNYFQILESTNADIIIVPEPATLSFLITGLAAMVTRKRRHN